MTRPDALTVEVYISSLEKIMFSRRFQILRSWRGQASMKMQRWNMKSLRCGIRLEKLEEKLSPIPSFQPTATLEKLVQLA